MAKWTADMIRRLRERLAESTEAFGARFARSPRTVEDWEQARRRPDALVRMEMERIVKRRKLADF